MRLVVEREREIEAFIPAEYWKIGGDLHRRRAATLREARRRQWIDFLTNTGNGERTKVEREKWLAEHDAFTAELVELAGKKFEADNKDDARKAAELLGFVVDKENTTEDPEAKGPAKNLTTLHRPSRQVPAVHRPRDREEAHDQQAAGAVHHQHAPAGARRAG